MKGENNKKSDVREAVTIRKAVQYLTYYWDFDYYPDDHALLIRHNGTGEKTYLDKLGLDFLFEIIKDIQNEKRN